METKYKCPTCGEIKPRISGFLEGWIWRCPECGLKYFAGWGWENCPISQPEDSADKDG